MSDITDLGVAELLEAYRLRRVSPVEAVSACAERIRDTDPELGAFTTLCLERAAQEARQAEENYARGGGAGPLSGLPFAAKDIFDTAEVRTTRGSQMFADHVPAADAEVVAALRAAGAILLGKTSTHEFAWGITSVNHQIGTSRNPRDPRRIAGGSSGGSAVAVSSGQVPFALGTDTGGSVRIPSSFCGTAGLKPTFGTFSCAGVWPLAATLDHVGAMARRVRDLCPVLEALGGPRTALTDRPDQVRAANVGVCPDLHLVALGDDLQSLFHSAVEALSGLTRGIIECAVAGADRIHPTFTTIQGAEAVISHRRAGLFPGRRAEYGDDVRGRLEAAAAISLEDYADASAERLSLDRTFAGLFEQVDLMITPISAVAPPLIGDENDVVLHLGVRRPLRDCVLPYTVPQDLLGLPACAVPAGVDSRGLPVGVQVWGARGRDDLVLEAAARLDAALNPGR